MIVNISSNGVLSVQVAQRADHLVLAIGYMYPTTIGTSIWLDYLIAAVASERARIRPSYGDKTHENLLLSGRLRSIERNCRQGHVYYRLRASGLSGRAAAAKMDLMSAHEQCEFLPDPLPSWQQFGGFGFWGLVPHQGTDPRTGEVHQVIRRRMTWTEINDWSDLREVLPILTASRPSVRS